MDFNGRQVKIIAVSFANHSEFIGRIGTAERFIKSRGLWRIRFSDGSTRDCLPINLMVL